jgi:uncharacterized protein YbjT (DUF2867 family)
MFVVTGVTGNTGSVVASQLLDAGKKVRVVVRDAAKAKRFADRGAEVAIADLGDAAGLERALRGAEGAYLLSPPDVKTNAFIDDKKALAATFATAVKGAAVPHVVVLSSIGAQHATGTGPIRSLHAIETALATTNAATTFVRPAYFVENWAAMLAAVKADGVLPSFLPKSLTAPMVAARDIGPVAARALMDGPRGRRTIALAGPVEVSPTEVAGALTRILGRTVTVTEAPLDAIVPTFTSFGISADVAGLFREMYEGMISGRVAWEKGDGESERGPTDVESALRSLIAS